MKKIVGAKGTVVKGNETIYRLFDKTGKLIGMINKSQEGRVSPDEWLKGVSCFVINEKGEVLIERRVNKGLTPGKLDLCSGHIDNFEIPIRAMIRELQEELGIPWEKSSDRIMVISKNTPAPLRFESSGKKRNFFIYFFCIKMNNPKIIFQKEEIDSIMWVPMEKCFELIRSGKTKFPKDYDYEEIFKQVEDFYYGKNKGEALVQE